VSATGRAALLLYAAAQFVVLTIVAMLVYPGGAKYDLGSDHYLFFQNFFSDLGATHTYSGKSNIASHVLFAIALGFVGLPLAWFSPAWKAVARRSGERTGLVAQAVAVVAGLGFVGIAATPWNHVLDAHNLFVKLAFGFLLVYIVCLLALQLRNGWPRPFVGVNVAHLAVLVAYVFVLFLGPGLNTKSGLEFQVAAQKVIVYASIANLGAQAFGIRRAPAVS
jgi:hypothetical protein